MLIVSLGGGSDLWVDIVKVRVLWLGEIGVV